MQDVWQTRCQWDDVLEKDFINVWSNWIIELKSLENLRIPRCIRRKEKPIQPELHAFSDARENGYDACVYLDQLIPMATSVFPFYSESQKSHR
jgi:hypothetical protein